MIDGEVKSTCQNCQHSAAERMPGEVVANTVCRRYPPVSFPTPQGIIAYFPPVRPDMVCGEHRANEWEFKQ